MKFWPRTFYTEKQKVLMWERSGRLLNANCSANTDVWGPGGYVHNMTHLGHSAQSGE